MCPHTSVLAGLCLCTLTRLQTHAAVAPTGSWTPLTRRVPILSNTSQRGALRQRPGTGAMLTNSEKRCQEKRFKIYDCEQDVLTVCGFSLNTCCQKGVSEYYLNILTDTHVCAHALGSCCLHSLHGSLRIICDKMISPGKLTSLGIWSDRPTPIGQILGF